MTEPALPPGPRLGILGVYRGVEDAPALAPRQGVLVPYRRGRVELNPALNPLALRDLKGFSRIWLIFWTDRATTWKPLVLPPHRTKRRGVFATRSPYRPNPLGLSAVALLGVDGHVLHVSGADLLDGTPILDIKPYLPWADSFPEAETGWVAEENAVAKTYSVIVEDGAEADLARAEQRTGKALRELLVDQLSLAPTLSKAKRIRRMTDASVPDAVWVFAFRTWRFHYRITETTVRIHLVVEERAHAGQLTP